MASTTNGLKRKQELDESSASELEIPPEKKGCQVMNILGIPNEILVKIIIFLDAKERIGLGDSCKKFNSLVYGDEELLRNLDFSKDGRLTLVSDVMQYFNNKACRDKIRGVNIRNTKCMKPGRMLTNSIGQASNLVDVNVHGIEFKDIWQLGSFINPMPNLRRLSFDWSEARESYIPMCCKVLQQPFIGLKYLSVELKAMDCLKVFIPSLRLCQELEKLRLVVKETCQTYGSKNWSSGEPEKLRNLKVVEYCGPLATEIKQYFLTLLQKIENWMDFELEYSPEPEGFYLSILDICEELADTELVESFQNTTLANHSNPRWTFIPELLLKEVLKITCEDVPEEFCCFSKIADMERCLLKIDEAERLMRNPRSQISYLCVSHPIDLGCDVHLVVSAFPNLTELGLAAITRNQESFPMDSHFRRRLKRRGYALPEELNATLNMDSSFKMIVENTPQLRRLTLGGWGKYENWDLDELHHIPKWKELQSLRLINIPIDDGEFLVEIGKQCKNLENLHLRRLGSYGRCGYEKELLQMLTSCQNLRTFSIESTYLTKTVEVVESLTNNKHLTSVRMNVTVEIQSSIENRSYQQSLTSTMKTFLWRCPKLTTFVGEFDCSRGFEWHRSNGLERLLDELQRPNLQIKLRWQSTTVGTVFEDSPHFNPYPGMWITI